ncbi:MAG: hypothetical protein AAGC77_13290 [Pseudomonadota bacterium]
MTFVNGVTLPNLGSGAAFAIWSFRAIATGCRGCGVLQKSFQEMFPDDGPDALRDMICFARVLGSGGARRIVLSHAGCSRITADELSIIAALSSAQHSSETSCVAHLNWLMGGKNTETALVETWRVANKFKAGGLAIDAPAIEISEPLKKIDAPVLSIVGNA